MGPGGGCAGNSVYISLTTKSTTFGAVQHMSFLFRVQIQQYQSTSESQSVNNTMLRLFKIVLALVATLPVASAGLVQRGKTRSVKLHNHAYQFRIPNTSGSGLTRELEYKQMWAENMEDRLWQLYRPEPFDGGAWPGGEGTFEILNGTNSNEVSGIAH